MERPEDYNSWPHESRSPRGRAIVWCLVVVVLCATLALETKLTGYMAVFKHLGCG